MNKKQVYRFTGSETLEQILSGMSPYECKVHGPTDPYVCWKQKKDGKGFRVFRTCIICKNDRAAKRNVEKKDEIKKYHADWYNARAESHRSRHRQIVIDRKNAVIDGYGGQCECCGEDSREFLTIDHINGGGSQLRKTTQKGSRLYRLLIKQGFPRGEYRLLCFNCNASHGFYGYCPHDREQFSIKGIAC